MFNSIQNFGKDRTFQVKVGSSLSSTKTQVNGTPQGALISPTLFNTAINNIKKAITDRNTNISQFADDCAVWKTWQQLKDKKYAKNKFNKMANSLANQATNLIKEIRKLGLKVNSTKTKAILFKGKKK